jgi:hypothetical protein
MLVRPPGNCPTCPCVPTALISGAYEERIMCISLLFQVCVGAECQKKPDPTATHTHFCYGGRWPTFGGKKIETAEIFVRKQKICSESQCVLLVSFVNLPPHILVDSWSSPFLSTSKGSPPPHFLTHSYTSVYELFNFKIVSQKVVHVCIILYSQI